MIKRILFNIKHLDLIDLQPEYTPLLEFDGVRFVLSILPQPNADALTLMYDGRIIACFGYIQVLPGVAEVWLLPSTYMSSCYIALVKEVDGYLKSTAEVFKWHRIQTVTQNIEQHRKWMNVLGFVEEGIMKNYLHQKDYVMSARFFDWSKP